MADKSNEILAIPKLLDMLAIDGAIVTIDAMGCQRAITRKIIDKKADYVLALKGNQGTLREDVESSSTSRRPIDFENTTVTRAKTIDADHGRIETRSHHRHPRCRLATKTPSLACLASSSSTALANTAGEIEQETRFYITSSNLPAEQMGPIVRSHWAVENSLHWVMDMVFRDDECRVRTETPRPTSPP